MLHELGDGDAAVDDVLAVVAGVVPAAADVEGVVAHAGLAGHDGVALVGGHAQVTGRPAVAGPQVVSYREAAALGVTAITAYRNLLADNPNLQEKSFEKIFCYQVDEAGRKVEVAIN